MKTYPVEDFDLLLHEFDVYIVVAHLVIVPKLYAVIKCRFEPWGGLIMEHAGTTLSIYDVPWEDLELTRQEKYVHPELSFPSLRLLIAFPADLTSTTLLVSCMLRALSTAMWPFAIFFTVRAALSAWRTLTDPTSTTSALAQSAKNWHSFSAIWGWKPSKFACYQANHVHDPLHMLRI
jgi:hypothetical protein